MRGLISRCATGLAACVAAGFLLASAATAQAPPPFPPGAPLPPEAAAVGHCLCLKAAADQLGSEMTAKRRALDDVRAQLAEASSRLEAERSRVDVNNPEAVARFRQMLEQRDALFRRSNGDMVADTARTVERYNARINEYNASCANRPMDPILVARLQPTLSCPPLY